MIRSLLALALVFALGCSKKDDGDKPEETPPAAKKDDTAQPAKTAANTPDLGQWDQFWPAFQAAAKAKDADALRKLSLIGEEFDDSAFNDMVSTFLAPEVLELIAKTDAEAVKVTSGTAGGDDEVRELSWMEESEIDGNKVESALIFSFKKVDGQYRLFRVVAAG